MKRAVVICFLLLSIMFIYGQLENPKLMISDVMVADGEPLQIELRTTGEYSKTGDKLLPLEMGNLGGTVTDAFTGVTLASATISVGTYLVSTDATGYYSIPELLIGDYDVYCYRAGYAGEMAPVTILEGALTVQDFTLDVELESPSELVATVDEYNVNLEWVSAFDPPSDLLRWDAMENADAIGMDGGGVFSVAARFTQTELAEYDGEYLTEVTAYIQDLPSAMTIYVWSGADAANILLEQTVIPVAFSWNTFEYNTPVMIDASEELWIGYEVTHDNLLFPAGCDAGPAAVGFGDMITMDGGVSWDALSLLLPALSANWNIWGGIDLEQGERVIIARPQPWHPAPIVTTNRNELSASGIGETVREFTGEYNVYRDDEVIATVTEAMYDDLEIPAGIYEYYVTAIHVEDESAGSNHVMAELGSAAVSVDPLMISETLDYGLTSDHSVTISNSGDASFDWTGAVQVMARFDVGETKPRPASSYTDAEDVSPEAQVFDVPQTREMWDLLANFTLDPTIISQAGIEFDGTYFYSAVWNQPSNISKFDIDGNLVETFTIPGVGTALNGIRDLAYDGEYFYGSNATTTIWQMDFATQTLIGTINSPVAVRAIAYDEVADAFWVNNWSSAVTLVSREGVVLNAIPCGTWGSFYGLAYDQYTPGGPYLYGFSQDGSGAVIAQIDIAAGVETGVIYDVFSDIGVFDDLAGGLFTTSDYVDGTFVIGGLLQRSYTLFIYELSQSVGNAMISIEPNNGSIEPGGTESINVHFNAVELSGITYYADIVFSDEEVMATVDVDFTITGSIPRPEITVNPMEVDVIAAVDGTADVAFDIGNIGNFDLEYDAEIFYYEGRAVAEAYPQDVDYWTGSTDGATFTQNSGVNAIATSNGWMMFDVSGIPDNAVINSIECNVYVNSSFDPWWSLTPCTLDPLATDASTLQAHIIAGNPSGAAYSYNNESGTLVPGFYTYTLGAAANADLAEALGQDWFAVGASPRDTGASYFTLIDGWNETNPPYLVIDYMIPMNPWVAFGGEMSVDGMVPVDGADDMYMLNFDAAGLIAGDQKMGEIVVNSNDLYNEEIVIPVTMTVGAAYVYGEVTGDDVVDAFDAANVLQFAVGMDPVGAPLPWTWELIAGNVDGNGSPEAYDAALVLQYAVGMITVFPVEARSDAVLADVTMSSENGELVFTTTGDLYGFSVITESELITFSEPVVEYLAAANGNAVALANAGAIEGDFLRIPYELNAETGEIVFTMTSNGISNEHTYNVEDLENGIVTVNAVLGNYPNPFNPSTIIMFEVKEESAVRVDIYNVKGQLVKSLVNGVVGMGQHSIEWTGNDNSNRSVSSGVYFYKVQIGSDNFTSKMIMLK